MKKTVLFASFLSVATAQAGIKNATMITTPSGEGQKITQVVLEYDELLHAEYTARQWGNGLGKP